VVRPTAVKRPPLELSAVFREMRRVLRQDGLALVSFHIGDQVVHVDDLFGAPVSLDFRFHVPDQVIEALHRAQLHVMEKVEREPYAGVEYPSRRCYLLARAAATTELDVRGAKTC
jgi:hypothetical protein